MSHINLNGVLNSQGRTMVLCNVDSLCNIYVIYVYYMQLVTWYK